MTVWIVGFFRCACGKIHCHAGMDRLSMCSCGLNLWGQIK